MTHQNLTTPNIDIKVEVDMFFGVFEDCGANMLSNFCPLIIPL